MGQDHQCLGRSSGGTGGEEVRGDMHRLEATVMPWHHLIPPHTLCAPTAHPLHIQMCATSNVTAVRLCDMQHMQWCEAACAQNLLLVQQKHHPK